MTNFSHWEIVCGGTAICGQPLAELVVSLLLWKSLSNRLTQRVSCAFINPRKQSCELQKQSTITVQDSCHPNVYNFMISCNFLILLQLDYPIPPTCIHMPSQSTPHVHAKFCSYNIPLETPHCPQHVAPPCTCYTSAILSCLCSLS